MRKIIKLIFIGLAVSGLFIFIAAQNKEQKSLSNMKNSHILVKKKARTLQIFDNQTLIKTYQISLGFKPEGDKEIEGDGKTPEGDFYIYFKNGTKSVSICRLAYLIQTLKMQRED